MPATLLSAAYLFSVLALVYHYMYQTLFRTWFFSSDEYVFAAEVIRFSSLDFRQHFFDIPGTPFIVLNTVIWSTMYGGAYLFDVVPPTADIGLFTFEHISALFIVMRATTLVCFLLSAVLLFRLVTKVVNEAAGAFASLLLLMSPIYSSYSSFVRTESFAMVLMLSATLWLIRGIERNGDDSAEPPRMQDFTVVAGILAGLAAGARLHSLAASLPILVMMLWTRRPETRYAYPAWVLRGARYGLPFSWAAAVIMFFLARTLLAQAPGAQSFISKGVISWMGLSLSAALFYSIPRTRPLVVRVIAPDVIKMLLGCGAGVLLGTPTIVTQYKFFLGTIQMYSGYVDWDRIAWPFWKNLTWYVAHYVGIVAPDAMTLYLLASGAVLILLARDRKMIPFLFAVVLFFFSKPISLRAGAHHAILWLPFFFAVSAYPVGKVFEFASRRLRHGPFWATGALAIFLYVSFQHLAPGPRNAAANAMASEARLHNIERATTWIKTNTAAGATVAISYFCFNPDTFYTWLRALEVPVPPSIFDGRQYIIWWGHASALKGKTGYACATKSDIVAMKTNLDLSSPGEGTDPYSDARFSRVASFGSGLNQVDLFRFDYR